MLWPVAGRGKSDQLEVTDSHQVAIAHPTPAGHGRDVGLRSRRRDQPPPPRNVVGVEVRLKHMADLSLRLVSRIQVLLDLPLRVDDSRLPEVGDEIGGAAQVLMKDLLEIQAIETSQ